MRFVNQGKNNEESISVILHSIKCSKIAIAIIKMIIILIIIIIIRKLFVIYGGLHPKSDFDKLYIPRENEGDI